MVVRGAGAIGATAAYGLAQGARAFRGRDLDEIPARTSKRFTRRSKPRGPPPLIPSTR